MVVYLLTFLTLSPGQLEGERGGQQTGQTGIRSISGSLLRSTSLITTSLQSLRVSNDPEGDVPVTGDDEEVVGDVGVRHATLDPQLVDQPGLDRLRHHHSPPPLVLLGLHTQELSHVRPFLIQFNLDAKSKEFRINVH